MTKILEFTPLRALLACSVIGMDVATLVIAMMLAMGYPYTPIASPIITPTFFGWWVWVIEGGATVLFTLQPLKTYKWIHGYDYNPEASESRLRGDYLFSFFVLSMFAALPKTSRFVGHFMLAHTARHTVGIASSNLTHYHTSQTHMLMLWGFFPIFVLPMLLLDPKGFATVL